MWCPNPKPKVISRPKLVFRQYKERRETPETQSDNTADEEEKEKKHDPHRDSRHYGMKHTDVTRIFMVADRNHHVPGDPPYGLKKTDVTRYLERVVPSHAFQVSYTNRVHSHTTPRNNNNANSNNTRTQNQPCTTKETLGDSRGTYPARPPSRCDARENRKSERESCRENLRPETAPTGEMKRLSATTPSTGSNAFTNKPATAGSGRLSMTSSHLAPIEEAEVAPSLNHQTVGTTSEPLGGMPCSESGLKDSNVGFAPCGSGSRSTTASSRTSVGRLQPVPE